MKLARIALVGLALCGSVTASAAVKLEKGEGVVEVTLDGKPYTTYHLEDKFQKPFFHPIRAVDGTVISRPLDVTGADHPHHKGMWVAIDEVNDIKFWAEKGKIKNVSVELTAAEGNPAQMKVVNHWVDADGKPVVIETSDISIYANGLFTYDITFTAGEKPVTFGDTKEGLFGIRLRDSLREKEGGQVTNAEGAKGTKEAWGQESAWVDYFGKADGKTHGVAIFDHPMNFRKSRYHVRDYGLFTISPFGRNAYTNGKLEADPLKLEPKANFRLRYGLYLHAGDTAEGKVAEVYKGFAK